MPVIYVKNKGKQNLTPDTFIASGGEGSIYRIGDTAYKIYTDPKKMIPIKKIEELNVLSHLKNVLRPQDIIFDEKQKPIGFTMSYVADVEFLTRLFNKNFRAQNNINSKVIIDIIKKMQITLNEIHKCGILVVDFNEMNSVTNRQFNDIFFIDVDSYQTKNYKATALMENVRDRKVSNNKFTVGSDWYSFAIVSFQLYMTYHPYAKGSYQNYTHKDMSKRMDDNISVFHPGIVIADIWKNFSVIPPAHLEWYKEVFNEGKRNPPPLPDGTVGIAPMPSISIIGNKTFTVMKLFGYTESIKSYFFINGLPFVITEKGIYRGIKKISTDTVNLCSLLLSKNDDVIKVKKENDNVFFMDNDAIIGESSATQYMHYENKIYTVWNRFLIEHKIDSIGKRNFHSMKTVCNIFGATTVLYSGVAIQNILGKCWVAIPYSTGKCYNRSIPQLDDHRIIDAKYENYILIVIGERKGKYKRFIFTFDESFSKYKCIEKENNDNLSVNFTCLSNGLCVHLYEDNYIDVFRDINKVKTVKDSPITTDTILVTDTSSILFINNKDLYKLSMR